MSNNSEYKAFTDQWMQSWEYLDRNQKSMNAVFDMCFNNGKFHIVTNGRDPFLSIVYTHSAMLDSAYQMRHMYFDGKNWLNLKGEALINGTWTSANGFKYADATSDLMMRMTA